MNKKNRTVIMLFLIMLTISDGFIAMYSSNIIFSIIAHIVLFSLAILAVTLLVLHMYEESKKEYIEFNKKKKKVIKNENKKE